jgi:hypothetical protein
MIRNSLLALFLLGSLTAGDGPTMPRSTQEQMGFEWLIGTCSSNFDMAARRKAAGKPEESAVILYSLVGLLDLTNPQIDTINAIAAEYKESMSDLSAECRVNEIIWRKAHPDNTVSYPIWTTPGFPLNFLARKDELLKKAIAKMKAELGEKTFQYLKENCFLKFRPSYGGTVGKPIK